jgi:FlaA1/EpsC-like NDP-sugar epimerase
MTDIAISVISPVCAFLLTNFESMPNEADGFLTMRITIKNLLLVGLFAFSWSNIFRAFGLYERRLLNQTSIWRLIAACTCGNFFGLVFVVTSRAGKFDLGALALSWMISVSLVVLTRLIMGSLFKQTILSKNQRQVLIVGSGLRALKLSRELRARTGDNYHLLGFVDSADAHIRSSEIRTRIIGDLSQLENILASNVVDEVLITLPIKSCYVQIQNTIQTCERLGVESRYLAELFKPTMARFGTGQLDSFTVTSTNRVQQDVRIIIKRAIDLSGAGVGLIVLSPLMLLIAISIRLT